MRNDNKNPKYFVRFIALPLALIMALLCASCGAVPAEPTIKIQEQPTASAGEVTISVAVENFSLNAPDKNQGHIIYYLDTAVPTYYEHSAISKAGTFAISGDTSYTWRGITPGEHRFSVQLVDNNNSPLPVPVSDSITVTVGAPEGKPAISILKPQDGSSLSPGNIFVAFDVSGFMVSRQDMGVVNREGEGHLIYYIDETPPVDAGVPATTDTSIVSTSLSHLWKAVKEGQHTFSVQLVNNDDTPLETPVVVTINIKVAA